MIARHTPQLLALVLPTACLLACGAGTPETATPTKQIVVPPPAAQPAQQKPTPSAPAEPETTYHVDDDAVVPVFELLWSSGVGHTLGASGGSTRGGSLAVTASGEMYLAGTIVDPASSNRRAYLAKIRATGQQAWIATVAGNSVEGVAVAHGGDNAIYLAGHYDDRLDTLPSATGTGPDIYVARYDAHGERHFLINGGPGLKELYGIGAVHGDLIIAGRYRSDAQLGPFSLLDRFARNPGPFSSPVDVFFARLGMDGTFGWVQSAGSERADRLTAFHVTPGGGIYAGVSFPGELTSFGATQLAPGNGVAKLTADGELLWSERVSYGTVSTVFEDSARRPWVASRLNGGHAALAAGSLTAEALSTIAGTTDPHGNIYLTGRFRGRLALANRPALASGTDAAFVLKLSASGGQIWAQAIAGLTPRALVWQGGALYLGAMVTDTATVGAATLQPSDGVAVVRILDQPR